MVAIIPSGDDTASDIMFIFVFYFYGFMASKKEKEKVICRKKNVKIGHGNRDFHVSRFFFLKKIEISVSPLSPEVTISRPLAHTAVKVRGGGRERRKRGGRGGRGNRGRQGTWTLQQLVRPLLPEMR